MNAVDIISFIIFISAITLGFYKGGLKLIIGSIFFISSIFLTALLTPILYDITIDYIHSALYTTIVSGVLSYIISLVLCTILSNQVIKFINPITDGLLDKFFGMLLGGIQSILLCIFLYTVLAIVSTRSYIDVSNHKEVKQKIKQHIPIWLYNSDLFYLSGNLPLDLIDVIPEKQFNDILKSINKSKKDVSSAKLYD
ncbi:colicin V production family protein [Orientia chuto str. Dubai]|uniref:Colicin V production family protein n=1 Tax=Orientia chuto str. Dubai TaxID=1359168 RepID=A0A0F3MG42_9RICK|nr:CvpA family protein [Candidatus Orientia mediorientalis]KJV54728.1 colicin V production family protein [Orientia chuto str. Dubai]